MDIAANRTLARRYFFEMVDKTSDQVLEELWAENCVAHRPEVTATINGREAFRQAFNRFVAPYREIVTTIDKLVAEDDLVVSHLLHRAVCRGGEWASRLGRYVVAEGKVVTWSAVTTFRVRDGKIAEQWVCRDDLGLLMQLGVLRGGTS